SVHARRGLVSALMAVTVAVAGSCAGADPAIEPPAPSPIRIAIINPQSGDFSSLGQWEHKGVKLAVDEANAAGGVDGRRIELSVFDDRGVAGNAAVLAEKVGTAGFVG